MTGLSGQDAACGSEIGLIHDAGGRTEVGADSNAFQNATKGKEGLDIRGREDISASLDKTRAGSLKSLSQELDVLLLVTGSFLKVGVERVLHTGLLEIGLGVVLKTFLIEGDLEVLKSRCIVKNIGVGDFGALSERGSLGKAHGCAGKSHRRELHFKE